jgi:hypothetical protein
MGWGEREQFRRLPPPPGIFGKKKLKLKRERDIIMVLQPFVGPLLLFQFLDLLHSRYDSLDGGSARLKAATYTQNNTNTE